MELPDSFRRYGQCLICLSGFGTDEMLLSDHGYLPLTHDELLDLITFFIEYVDSTDGAVLEAKRQEAEDLYMPATTGTASTARVVVKPKKEKEPAPVRTCCACVYLLEGSGHYKIGMTRDFDARYKAIRLHMPFPVTLRHKITSKDIARLERYWHDRFAGKRTNGEWFRLDDSDVAEFCAQSEMDIPT